MTLVWRSVLGRDESGIKVRGKQVSGSAGKENLPPSGVCGWSWEAANAYPRMLGLCSWPQEWSDISSTDFTPSNDDPRRSLRRNKNRGGQRSREILKRYIAVISWFSPLYIGRIPGQGGPGAFTPVARRESGGRNRLGRTDTN